MRLKPVGKKEEEVSVNAMSVPSHPKDSFRNRLDNGDFLSLTVWAGKSDPNAEVITVQIRRLNGDIWETVGRLAAYRPLMATTHNFQNTEHRNRKMQTSIFEY